MAELFTFFFLIFGIPQHDGNVHLSTSPNYHTAVTHVRGQRAPRGAHASCSWTSGIREETLRLIERYRCTHTHMVPTQFHRMLQLPDDVQREVRRVVDEVGDPRGGAVPDRREAARCSTGGAR